METREDYLVFGQPLIEDDEIEEVVKTLRSGWIGTGPKVAKYESEFKEYVGNKFAVALNSANNFGIATGRCTVGAINDFAGIEQALHCDFETAAIDALGSRHPHHHLGRVIAAVRFVGNHPALARNSI